MILSQVYTFLQIHRGIGISALETSPPLVCKQKDKDIYIKYQTKLEL